MTRLCRSSRQLWWMGWAMSACIFGRFNASRPRFGAETRTPHSLQNFARQGFFSPQRWHRSMSLRLGMATKGPLVPSMTFRSRMTKLSSSVMLQKALSLSLFDDMSLIRTSVISTTRSPFEISASSCVTLQDCRTRPGLESGWASRETAARCAPKTRCRHPGADQRAVRRSAPHRSPNGRHQRPWSHFLS